MDAQPILVRIVQLMEKHGLEAVLIGNMAAAVQGSPVTTIDFDFYFRATPRNVARLKRVAKDLDAMILRPYYPTSSLFRLQRDQDGLQVDFLGHIAGIRSFEGLRSRATVTPLGGAAVLVAGLPDIIRSKRAANRPKDRAVLDILEKTLEEKRQVEQAAAAQPSRGARARK